MNAMEKLEEEAREIKSILCFGIDPDLSRISKKEIKAEKIQETIENYFLSITEKLTQENQIVSIKPNYAYFAQYGFEGLFALKTIIEKNKNKINIILDGKRGDIGTTAKAYAKEMYDFWNADAVTVAPYMGSDSITPFIREEKTVYVLCKTSNKSSSEFQDLKVSRKPIYEIVATKARELRYGLVVGATSEAIKKINNVCSDEVPFLIPGIGNQGGDLEFVMKAIRKNPWIHRINSSSGIAYAKQTDSEKAVDCALLEAQKLNSQMRKYF